MVSRLLIASCGALALAAASSGSTSSSSWELVDGSLGTAATLSAAERAAAAIRAEKQARVVEAARGVTEGGGACEDDTEVPDIRCPAGFFCKKAATASAAGEQETLQIPCPAGYYCPPNTTAHANPFVLHRCRGPSEICPEGSRRPQPVTRGHYSSGAVAELPLTGSPSLHSFLASTSLEHAEAAAAFFSSSSSASTLPSFSSQQPCPVGSFCIGGMRHPCPAGSYCPTSLAVSVQQDEHVCAAGYVCPEGSWLEKQAPCGGVDRFCPAGSGEPTFVQEGWYTVGGGQTGGELTRTGARQCEAGWYCSGGMRHLCPGGSACPRGGMSSPGDMKGGGKDRSSSSSSSGEGFNHGNQCEAGYYCPEGSTSTRQRQCGDFVADWSYVSGNGTAFNSSSRSSWSSSSSRITHVNGTGPWSLFCPSGSEQPSTAALGYFTIGSSGSSLSADDDLSLASAAPSIAVVGAVAAAAAEAALLERMRAFPEDYAFNVSRQVAEVQCPPGSFCSEGRRFLCPAGRYGQERGETRPKCTDACWPGYICPQGSISGTQQTCGDPSVFCSGGNVDPEPVPPGYYSVGPPGGTTSSNSSAAAQLEQMALVATGASSTTRTGVRPAQRGYYADRGIQMPCPAGRFGHRSAEALALCAGECSPGYFCPRASVRPTERLCGASDVYCPRGSAFPLPVSAGHFGVGQLQLQHQQEGPSTTPPTRESTQDTLWDMLAEECPPGMFRNLSARVTPETASEDELVLYFSTGERRHPMAIPTETLPPAPCHLCAEGTFKARSGDSEALCVPCEAFTSESVAGRTTCECHRLSGGADPGNATVSVGFFFNATSATCQSVSTEEEAHLLLLGEPFPGGGKPPPEGRAPVVEAWSIYARSGQLPCLAGSFCIKGMALECPAGRYGDLDQETRPLCSGPCQAGYFCPRGSTSPTERACGGVHLYCPASSVAPIVSEVGYFTDEDRHEHIRTSQSLCPMGYWCPGDGKRYPCPKGSFGAEEGLTVSSCSGECRQGFRCPEASETPTPLVCGPDASVYCPPGSFEALPVADGYYTVNALLPGRRVRQSEVLLEAQTRSAQVICEEDFWCSGGLKHRCPAGTFGWEYGLTSSEQCPTCPAGYYCPPGEAFSTTAATSGVTAVPRPEECGGVTLFCPRGAAAPSHVGVGMYTVGEEGEGKGVGPESNEFRRTAQLPCPKGHWCSRGVKAECPAGTFGNEVRLSREQCSGLCPAGHYCPTGSAQPLECADGEYSGTGAFRCSRCPSSSLEDTSSSSSSSSSSRSRCKTSRMCCGL